MTTRSLSCGSWWRVFAPGLFLIGPNVAPATSADNPPPVGALGADLARRAVAPVAPDLAGSIVAALQGGDYAAATRELDAILADPKTLPADRSFYCLVRGGADRLAGRPNDARSIWQAALGVDPNGAWANKLRGELAALELATGHPDRAEALARQEVETLLSPDRKDRLAGVYRDFADRLLHPTFPGAQPDPKAAYALLLKARDLAKGPKLRASLLYALGRAGQQASTPAPGGSQGPKGQANVPSNSNPNPDPIQDYSAYLKEYPQGDDRFSVRFHLGEAQLALGRVVDARTTWTDLARDLAKQPAGAQSKETQRLRGQALYGIARTYGVPKVADNLSLNLGVAALQRFLRETPADPNAPIAAFEIGQTYLNRGQADPAIAAFRSFLKGDGYRIETDDARRDQANRAMQASFLIARALLGQAKYPEAITAFEAYLNQYPNGAESADARRAILDAQIRAANDAFSREQYAEARAGYLKFAATNPLDARVPTVLFQVGYAFAREKQWDEAIAAWDVVIARFPTNETAAQAQFEAASILETEKGEPTAAIERFRKVPANFVWGQRAQGRIAVMEAKALTVVTPRTFRSGETAQLKIATRNLETLTFSAYKLNPEAYFRKKHGLGGVNSLDVGLVAPDAEWTLPVPNYARYRPVEANFDLKISVPGVYVVKVSDEKTLQAAALVIGSDVDAILKVSRGQILAFAQDMKTGQGRPGARVLIANGASIVYEGTTGPDGVAQGTWSGPEAGLPAPSLQYLVLDGPNAAGSELGVPDQVARGLTPRAYIDTDRPAYRPGQTVAIRGVVREVADGQYSNPAGLVYKLEVSDSQGRALLTKEISLSPFGTFHESVALADGAQLGSYRVRLSRPGGSDFAGNFEVQAYQLEKLGLEFDLPQTVFERGETIRATLKARYGFGAPASGRPIRVRLPDGRTLSGQTDAQGQFPVEFPTEGYGEDQALTLLALLPADNVSAGATVRIATQGFGIILTTPRSVYLDGETLTLAATTLDMLGKPTGQDLRVAVIKPVAQGGRIIEREVASQPFATDKGTGKGQVALRVQDPARVFYILRVTGTDRFGNPIVADHRVLISGANDDETLRIIADRTSYRVGEAASVRIVNRAKAGTALIAWEADRILRYQVLPIRAGETTLEWPVEGAQFPNFTLTANQMVDQKFASARLDLKVERDLRIRLQPKTTTVAPGAEIEVEVTAVDQMNHPVQAELALALVDRTLLAQFGDKLPPIGPFFYDQTRLGSFRTEATNTFRDTPTTQPVSNAVVEESERQAALGRDATAGVKVKQSLPVLAKPAARFDNRNMADVDQAMIIDLAAPDLAKEAGGPNRAGRVLARERLSAAKEEGTMEATPETAAWYAPSAKRSKLGTDQLSFGYRGSGDLGEDKDDFGQFQVGLTFAMPKTFAELSNRRQRMNSPRAGFVETAYWNPSVVTGTDGKATVKFPAPEALSEYRLMAKGVTGAETLVGQNSTNLLVRKDFYVDLRTPSRLTEGDKPRFLARVHHLGLKAGTSVQVKFNGYAGDQDQADLKSITVPGDGVSVSEVEFDPITIPDAESIRLTVSARAGDLVDEVAAEVPVHPWGVEAIASASGTASSNATAFVSLPAGRRYEDLGMEIQLAPTLDRLVVALALGHEFAIMGDPVSHEKKDLAPSRIIWPPSFLNPTADRAADLLAAVSGLVYLRDVRSPDPGETTRLRDRARGLVADLIATQNGDGGWPWVPPRAGQNPVGSDRAASAAAGWALKAAANAGVAVDQETLEKATGYLSNDLNRTGADLTGRADVLHTLAVLGHGSFEGANSLNRTRPSLSDVALAHLALTFQLLQRPSLANEVLDLLATRAKTEVVGPGAPPQKFWDQSSSTRYRGRADTTALVALAFAEVRPGSPELEQGVAWLLAHRAGLGWSPHQAQGAAVAAIAATKGKAGGATDRYRLVVTVNDAEVARIDVEGATGNRTVAVPRKVLKIGAPNAVRFAIEGRGTFGYAATLSGFARDFAPEQQQAGKPFVVAHRNYLPAAPELDGKPLPVGASKVINPSYATNLVTQVPRGGRIEVGIDCALYGRPLVPNQEREFLIVEETLPAGATLVAGSVQTNAGSYTVGDGVLTLAFAPENGSPQVHYELAGYLPGEYRALPTRIRDAYDPSLVHLGPTGSLRVLEPGAVSTDPYRASPDELFARGQRLAEAGRLAEAAVPLEELLGGYTPTDEVARDTARILLSAHIASYDARKIVRDFEILKEKGPEVIVPFDEVLVVGRAYRDIDEPERAFLVFRALAEASYLEDAQVGEVLRQNGRPLEAITYLLDLWRESPGSAAIEADLFGLSQVLTADAGKAINDPTLRARLAEANLARPELLAQAIRLVQTMLALNPQTPLADEASLALLGAELDLENFDAVTKLAPRYAALYPKSSFLDSFQYADALSRFQLGEFDRAIEVATKIAAATYPDANGLAQPSPNRWQALYILGQIHDARRQPAQAIEFYRQVADRFADAADAVAALGRKALKLPEVTILRPGTPLGQAVNLNPDPAPAQSAGSVVLTYRNVTEVDLKVYPVDLMRLYLTRRNLDAIAGIDLAGITPLYESTVKLNAALNYAEATRPLDLPLSKEGAYLVMVRGGDLYASGIVLVSPIELEVTEESQAGRVRVVVRDAESHRLVPRVQVKVIGSHNPTFTDNRTDLRGVAVAEGINGQVTAVARTGTSQYAFYRGTESIGAPPTPANAPASSPAPQAPSAPAAPAKNDGGLMENINQLNNSNAIRGIDRLQNRLNEGRKGIKAEEAK